jgi:4-amino-4-deoxy-L-arabinose transferase-like glycosyltransferase
MLPRVLGEGAATLAQPLHRSLDWVRANPFLAAAAALGGIVVALHFADLKAAPPGFFSDEASVAYDAQGIATDLRDEHGDLLPVFFRSFGQWRAPLFVYAVAAVFRVAGPGVVQARAVGTTIALLTAVLIALLVQRLFGERWLSLGTFGVVAVTPWLFTNGRLAFEPVTLPAVLAGFLLLWQRADQTGRPELGLAAGFVLGLTVYAAIVAWLFAPLLCLALVLAELPRFRWRLLLAAGLGVDLALLPMLAYLPFHPGMLTARYQTVQAWLPGQPPLVNLGRSWRVYASGFSPDYLFNHANWIQGGEFFAVLAPALVVGLLALWEVRRERFWRLVFLGLLFAPIPSALASDFSHDFRNIEDVPFYLAIMALGVSRLWPLLTRRRLVAAGVAGLLAFQAVWFLADYYTRTPGRMTDWQTAGFEQAVRASVQLAHGGRILLEPDLFSAETFDPQASQVAFAFFAGEPVSAYRRAGIGAMNAAMAQPGVQVPGAVVIALKDHPVPGARLLTTIWVTYPDDWGTLVSSPAYQVWQYAS